MTSVHSLILFSCLGDISNDYTPFNLLSSPQDFTGVPAVVDLACMRDAMNKLGSDSNKINPLVIIVLVCFMCISCLSFFNYSH